jgi:hypothetical protein
MKTIPVFVFLLISTTLFGQDISAWQTGSTLPKKKTDAEILSNANYILNHPIDVEDETRNEAMGSVLFWMYSTPDYTFFIDETIVPLIKNDSEILALYMVAMAQYVLENPQQAENHKEVKLQAFSRLLNYCNDPKNKIEKTKAIAEAIYAMQTGWLKEYLKIS